MKRSYSGPEVTPWTSSIMRPGKVALGVRRKKAAASRSSTKKPTGSARAIQVRSRRRSSSSWKRGARERGVHVVERGKLELGDRGHGATFFRAEAVCTTGPLRGLSERYLEA